MPASKQATAIYPRVLSDVVANVPAIAAGARANITVTVSEARTDMIFLVKIKDEPSLITNAECVNKGSVSVWIHNAAPAARVAGNETITFLAF